MPHFGEPADTTLVDIKIKTIILRVDKLSYTSDHGVLTDQTADWKRGTTKYADKDPFEWVRNKHRFPITQSKNTALKVKVVFRASSRNTESVSGKIRGDGGRSFLRFEGSGSFDPGTNVTVEMAAPASLPDRVRYRKDIAITWTVEGGGETHLAGSTGPSSVYVTMQAPKDDGSEEDGPTHRRVHAATRLVERVGSNDPHTIVESLMRRFPGYTLKRNPNVPTAYKHPTYFNGVGGAWPIYEHISASAECQAIVRFVKGVIHQVGCPGKAEPVVVYANYNTGDAIESPYPHGGMSSFGALSYRGKTVYPTLVDQAVQEGQAYPASHTPLRGGGGSPGFNNFEACLKFTHGDTRYYGGGAGTFKSKAEVIRAFQALVWVSADSTYSGGVRIERIVRRYH
jgi:hypothetical protein